MNKPQPAGVIVNLVEQNMDTDTGQPRADIVLCGLQNVVSEDDLRAFAIRLHNAISLFEHRKRREIAAARETIHAKQP